MSHQIPLELTPRVIILAIVLAVILGYGDDFRYSWVLALSDTLHFGGWLGLLMLATMAMLLYRLAVRIS